MKKFVSAKNPDVKEPMDADKELKFSGNSSQLQIINNNGKHDNFDKQLKLMIQRIALTRINKRKSKCLKYLEDKNANLKAKLKDSENNYHNEK